MSTVKETKKEQAMRLVPEFTRNTESHIKSVARKRKCALEIVTCYITGTISVKTKYRHTTLCLGASETKCTKNINAVSTDSFLVDDITKYNYSLFSYWKAATNVDIVYESGGNQRACDYRRFCKSSDLVWWKTGISVKEFPRNNKIDEDFIADHILGIPKC